MIVHVKVNKSTKYYKPTSMYVFTRQKKRFKLSQNTYLANVTHVARCDGQNVIGHKNQCHIMIVHVKVNKSTKYCKPTSMYVFTRQKKRFKLSQNTYLANVTHVATCDGQNLIGHKN